jgi:tetratricopeptide (TPR) repeat protein
VARKRITGIGVGGPLGSASLAWEYADDPVAGLGRGCLVLQGGRLPKVREVIDPVMLGVHPSSPVHAGSRGPAGEPLPERVPAYVPRDVDGELRRRLAVSGFVLVVGDSTAGKSRAAIEAIAALPDHALVVPHNRESVPVAVDKAAGTRRCVLWLDDLERYLGPGGLTRAGVSRLLAGKRAHRVIVATLRAAEEALVFAADAVPENGARQSHREAREVLEQAHRVFLPRIFSQPEQERAWAWAFDPRIADALAHMSVYGLAEYAAAGPELMRDWEDAWSPNTDPRAPSHPRGAALVTAAVEVRRGGYASPLPREVLEAVHDHYLRERGGVLLRPEPLAEAWDWATSPRRATTALLQSSGNQHVHVFDYLLDTVQRRSASGDYPPDSILEVALAAAAPADAGNIADLASYHGRYQLAEAASLGAYRTLEDRLGPEHAATLEARAAHANTLRNLGRYAEYESEHQTITGIAARVFGPEDPLTLGSRTGRAFALIRLRRPAEAEEELRAVQDIATRVLGPEHDATMRSRHLRAIAQHHLGKLAEAEAENRSVLAIWTRVLGPEDMRTLLSRGNLAMVLDSRGQREEAEEEAQAVLEIRTRIFGPEHPETLRSRRARANLLRRAGRNDESESEHQTITGIAARVYGSEDPLTLGSRTGRAFALIRLRRPAEAEEELRAVQDIATRVLGPEHDVTMTSRHLRAIALHDLGKLAEAEAENRSVLAIWTRVLGPENDSTLRCRTNLAAVLQDAGQAEEAEKEAHAVLEIRMRTLGDDHPDTAYVRSLLAQAGKSQEHSGTW